MEHIPKRSAEPPERGGYWEEQADTFVGVVYAGEDGKEVHRTMIAMAGNTEENKEDAFRYAQTWARTHQGEFDIEVEQVSTETIAHSTDPDDYPERDR